jgi:hypothetical protein
MNAENLDLDIFKKLPVIINGSLGDALQPTQWRNTIEKLDNLYSSGHEGHIMVPTKYVVNLEKTKYLFLNYPNIWLWIAITGLQETKFFSFQDYQRFYFDTCNYSNRVVCAIRPIIPGRNNNFSDLLPILEMTRAGNKLLTYSGYRDPDKQGSPKYEEPELFSMINSFCLDNSIVFAKKCICLIAKFTNSRCVIHNPLPLTNIKLIERLGYKFKIDNDEIQLSGESAEAIPSRGDVAFVRLITRGKVTSKQLKQTIMLSLKKLENLKIGCSSSWFAWSKQVPCMINCDYCIADYSKADHIDISEIGCNPQDILSII